MFSMHDVNGKNIVCIINSYGNLKVTLEYGVKVIEKQYDFSILDIRKADRVSLVENDILKNLSNWELEKKDRDEVLRLFKRDLNFIIEKQY